MGYPCVQKWQCPFQFLLDGKLSGKLNRVQVLVKPLNLALGEGCQSVIHLHLSKGNGLRKWQLLFVSHQLATHEPIAVPEVCWYASPL